jgi:hypothetical protein
MTALTPEAARALHELAQRYAVSDDAATTLLFAVNSGGGTMAQFSHPELGGSGQWMMGGMTMVGDMFNHGLQAKVSGLCTELSNLLRSLTVFVPQPMPAPFSGSGASGGWWPSELGYPSSSGGQNDLRYAYFPQVRRLAVQRNGRVEVYDALDHQIGGVQQQQGGGYPSLSFSSQRGTFSVESLPLVSGGSGAPVHEAPPAQSFGSGGLPPVHESAPVTGDHLQPRSQNDVLSALERLGDLRQKGILTEDEFQSKKAELLRRL